MSDRTAAGGNDRIERIARKAEGDGGGNPGTPAGPENPENALDPDNGEGNGDDGARRDGDLDLEAPEADSAEQRTELLQRRDDPATAAPADRDGEANPADTAEQRRVAGVDDEDEDESRR